MTTAAEPIRIAPSDHASVAADPGILAEITADLSSGADIRALLRRFLDPIVRLAHARAGAVRVLCEGNRLRLVSEVGLPPQLGCAEQTVDRHCGSCGRAVDAGELSWSSTLAGCSGNARALLAPLGCEHMLAVPLAHRGRVLGVYNLFFDRAQGPSDEARTLLRSVGDLLGLALDNARLEAENLRAVVMQERQMMSAEVHDAVAQDLTFLRMRLPLLEQAIGERDEAQTARYLEDLRQALGHAQGSLREIISEFRAPLDPRGLAHGLSQRVDEFSARSGVPTVVDNQLPALVLPPTHESQVLHIVGEALTNIAHHAQAHQAWLTVQPREGQVEIRVEDDGAGLRRDGAEPGHHGIAIMGERARRLGGSVSMRERDGGGTVVALRFPVPGSLRQEHAA